MVRYVMLFLFIVVCFLMAAMANDFSMKYVVVKGRCKRDPEIIRGDEIKVYNIEWL